jgi:hypothetical protein
MMRKARVAMMDNAEPDWESEYAEWIQAQESEERELREAEDVLTWHLMYQAKPKEDRSGK